MVISLILHTHTYPPQLHLQLQDKNTMLYLHLFLCFFQVQAIVDSWDLPPLCHRYTQACSTSNTGIFY